MQQVKYTLAEVRSAMRLLEDLELGRWPGRQEGVPLDHGAHRPEAIGALFAAGEVLEEMEALLERQRLGVCGAAPSGLEEEAA